MPCQAACASQRNDIPASALTRALFARLCHGNPTRVAHCAFRPRSGGHGCSLPRTGRIGPEQPERAAGDEVALKLERVADRSMGPSYRPA